MSGKESHRFFSRKDCEYFPCHKNAGAGDFNCLFCFCPLYYIDECGGKYKYTKSGVKDCSQCLIPHDPDGYAGITERIKQANEERSAAVLGKKAKT